MSAPLEPLIVSELRHEIAALRGNWLWFVVVGALLVLLGSIALGAIVVASLAAAIAIGAILILGGVIEIVGSIWSRRWSGFFLHLLSGLLSIVVGVLFLRAPANALFALTLLIAAALLVSGSFKIVAALSFRFAAWGWALASGLIDLVLGILIWHELPASAFWVVGMFVGISLIFRGFNWLALGLALRTIPKSFPE